MPPEVSCGKPYPLGATPDAHGVNFALFSEHAESVQLCLFDSPGARAPSAVVPLPSRSNDIFHAYLKGASAGQVYGYRVHGPWAPARGHRFNSRKLLLDPYARVIARTARWDASAYPYEAEAYPDPAAIDQSPSDLDSAASAPLGMVAAAHGSEAADASPRTAWKDTVIYELHVRGFTQLHPEVPEAQRGTYAGLASEPVIEYLRGLGVTAIELLPVQHHLSEPRLEQRGLTNYWGYQPLAYFAPEPAYAASPAGLAAVREFRAMVRRFHAAGIEIILDVVYNHTGELGHDGPAFSFRGIDNASYYRLDPVDRRRYVDCTGCGNALNTHHRAVARLVLDSLRYWVEEMGVDGFRFDLATTLGRRERDFDANAPLFVAIEQDPALQGIKFLAEPWDLAPRDGDQLGRFPAGWAEWNRCFRDDARRFWRGDAGLAAGLATRFAGSSDLFAARRRPPQASLNYVTAHDGFTLRDLVSYSGKRNEANGEGNHDGDDCNHSWNCGQEGPASEVSVRTLRERQQRNLLATLILSQGVPMLLAGDESGRTQRGNNNAYCQDNEISWLDWNSARDDPLIDFARRLVRLRRSEAVFRRQRFFDGRPDPATGRKDVTWLDSNGQELAGRAWEDPALLCFGALIAESDGTRILVLFNGSSRTVRMRLPQASWRVQLDTTAADHSTPAEAEYLLGDRSLAVLKAVP